MSCGTGANFFANQMRTRAAASTSRTSLSSALSSCSPILSSSTLCSRQKRLTTVLICLPLGLITLLLLCIFTSSSESAALNSNSERLSSLNLNLHYNFSDRFTDLHFYPKTIPKVFLRLNGESGIVNPIEISDTQESSSAETEYKQSDDNMEPEYQFQPSTLESEKMERDGREIDYTPVVPNNYEESAPPEKHWMEYLTDQTSFNPYIINSNLSLNKDHFSSGTFNYENNDRNNFQKKSPPTPSPSPSTFPLPSPTPMSYSYPYSSYSEEDLENVADIDDDHSKYFIKTKPRNVAANIASIFNNKRAIPSSPPSESSQVFSFASPPNSQHSEEEQIMQLQPQSSDDDAKTLKSTEVYDDMQYMPKSEFSLTLPSPATPSDLLQDFSSTTTTTTSNLIADITNKYDPDATSIPGMPGIDYPILDEIPYTGFDCRKQRYKGFFADIDTKCQAWHYCDFTDGQSTFLCPNGTLFSQVLLTCDWWFNVDCRQAQQLYVLNERLYRYIKPPKPSFPEDYSGPQVDKWLLRQLQLGLLPKMNKRAKAKLVAPNNN